jgi:uncharacterized protein YjbI with pentapeptide repeats
MHWRSWFICLVLTVVYSVLAIFTLYKAPELLVAAGSFDTVPDAYHRERLVVDAQNSARTSAVAVLTSSALGVAGLVALVSYTTSRRDAQRSQTESQDELFTRSLELLASPSEVVLVGALSTLAGVAKARDDLRRPTLAIFFMLLRSRRHLDDPIDRTIEARACADLQDRDPVAAAALRLVGDVPLPSLDSSGAGLITARSLEGSDLRRLALHDVELELVDFSGSYFWDAKLVDCTFKRCLFPLTDWHGAMLRRVRFVECDLRQVDLSVAQQHDVSVEGSTTDS